MATENASLFERLNAPFPYVEYKYDRFGDRSYISGQAIAERLNEVLGVGFWKYEGLHETEKIIEDSNGKSPRVKIYVRFSFYNRELEEWITFVDVGSEAIKPGMNEGDATKSAATDALKKCASRIGVASDLYKGLITWDKQREVMVVPEHYDHYYKEKGWHVSKQAKTASLPPQSFGNRTQKKTALTDKLKNKSTSVENQVEAAWQELAGSLDGLDEWVAKKRQEKVTDHQMLNVLQQRLAKKKSAASA